MELKEVIMKRFLRKLLNLNIWGGRHTELKNLQKSLPDHLRGCKESKEAIKDLILDVINLKEGIYEIEQWDTYTGNVVSSSKKSINGTISIEVPLIDKDIAYKVRIKK